MSLFDDMYIPWTPYLGLKKPQPQAPALPAAKQAPEPQLCTRTLHIAKAIIAHAVEPYPEIARAISAAFIAFVTGDLVLNLTGPPSTWAVADNAP